MSLEVPSVSRETIEGLARAAARSYRAEREEFTIRKIDNNKLNQLS